MSQINGGNVYFGQNSVTGNCCGNAITADGGIVILNTGALSASKLILDGGVTITSKNLASPPPPPPPTTGSLPPGHGGTPPGQGGLPPGLGGGSTPAFGGANPGHGGTPPGQGSTPGHGGTPPGLVPYSDSKTSQRSNVSEFRPVAFVQGGGTSVLSHRIWQACLGRRCTLRAIEGSSIFVDSQNNLDMHHGECVLQTNEPTKLWLGDVCVECEKGHSVLVNKQDADIKLRCLDGIGRSVKISFAGRQIRLFPGQEVVICGDANAAMNDDCARRKVTRTDAGTTTIITSEVSFTSLATASPVLRNLLRGNDKLDAKLQSRLLKTAACLGIVTNKHGAFTTKN